MERKKQLNWLKVDLQAHEKKITIMIKLYNPNKISEDYDLNKKKRNIFLGYSWKAELEMINN